MKRIITLLLLLTAFSGTKSFAQQYCEAAFEYEILQGSTVAFYNASWSESGEILDYVWNYGPNTFINDPNPVITFEDPVSLICLSIFTADSCTSVACDTLYFNATGGDCTADFSTNQLNPDNPNAYTFIAYANGTPPFSYFWDFGGLAYGTLPTETFEFPSGLWDVTLTISDNANCSSSYTESLYIEGDSTVIDSMICNSVLSGASPYGQEDPIFQEVIANDVWCCESGWDQLCQTAYDEILGIGDSCYVDIVAYQNSIGSWSLEAYTEGAGPFSFEWYFENQVIGVDQSIVYDFEPGVYQISVNAFGQNQCFASQTITIIVEDQPACSAQFYLEYDPNQQGPTFELGFFAAAENEFYSWIISTPIETFGFDGPEGWLNELTAGDYEICLEVINEDCSDFYCEYISLGSQNNCDGSFEYSVYSDPTGNLYQVGVFPIDGAIGYEVFIDGDFIEVDFSPNGVWFEIPPGTYDMCMLTVFQNCEDYVCQVLVVDGIDPGCNAEFEIEASFEAPYFLGFFTEAEPESFVWEVYGFGDSVFLYNQFEGFEEVPAGEYTVCLSVFTPTCSDYSCQTVYFEEDQTGCSAEFQAEYQMDAAGNYNVDLYLVSQNVTIDMIINGAFYGFDTIAPGIININLPAGTYEICLTTYTNNCNDGSCQTIILEGNVDDTCETILNQSSPYGEDDAIFQQVIAQDYWCCDVFWDGICQAQYDGLNGVVTDTLGVCMTTLNGSSPYGEDDPYFQQVIEIDPWCCNNGWDALCQCAYDDFAGIYIDPNSGTSICGDVFGGSPTISSEISGTVYLIAFNPEDQTLYELQSQTFGPNGTDFCFDLNAEDLNNQGLFFLKAALDGASPYYDSLMPTYYGGSIMWWSATAVGPGEGYTIYMTPGVNPGGEGFVGGEITAGAGKSDEDLSGVAVQVLNLDRSPVAYVVSDENGEFDFSELPFGTYQLIADPLGQRIVPQIITISAESPSMTGIEIEVRAIEEVDNGLGELFFNAQQLDVYPNPVESTIRIDFTSNESQKADLTIYNLLGQKVVSSNLNVVKGSNQIQNNLSSLIPGTYFIELNTEDGQRYTGKIMKN